MSNPQVDTVVVSHKLGFNTHRDISPAPQVLARVQMPSGKSYSLQAYKPEWADGPLLRFMEEDPDQPDRLLWGFNIH